MSPSLRAAAPQWARPAASNIGPQLSRLAYTSAQFTIHTDITSQESSDEKKQKKHNDLVVAEEGAPAEDARQLIRLRLRDIIVLIVCEVSCAMRGRATVRGNNVGQNLLPVNTDCLARHAWPMMVAALGCTSASPEMNAFDASLPAAPR